MCKWDCTNSYKVKVCNWRVGYHRCLSETLYAVVLENGKNTFLMIKYCIVNADKYFLILFIG